MFIHSYILKWSVCNCLFIKLLPIRERTYAKTHARAQIHSLALFHTHTKINTVKRWPTFCSHSVSAGVSPKHWTMIAEWTGTPPARPACSSAERPCLGPCAHTHTDTPNVVWQWTSGDYCLILNRHGEIYLPPLRCKNSPRTNRPCWRRCSPSRQLLSLRLQAYYYYYKPYDHSAKILTLIYTFQLRQSLMIVRFMFSGWLTYLFSFLARASRSLLSDLSTWRISSWVLRTCDITQTCLNCNIYDTLQICKGETILQHITYDIFQSRTTDCV